VRNVDALLVAFVAAKLKTAYAKDAENLPVNVPVIK
jgi:hypothetical protein